MALTQAEVQETVEGFLRDADVTFAHRETPDHVPQLQIDVEATAVFVEFETSHDGRVVVEVTAPLVHDLERSDALLARLNELNEGLYFGKVYWYKRAVFVTHSMLADGLPRETFLYILRQVGVVANKLVDEFKTAFGGKLYREA